MTTQEQLKDAKYLHRPDGLQPGGHTDFCLMCSWHELVNNGHSNEYEYCKKLRIRVESFDICRYFEESLSLGPYARTDLPNIPKKRSWLLSLFKKD